MYDEQGLSTWFVELDSFGNVKLNKGDSKTECPFRYQGQYEDVETGLYYNRFRYYDPNDGGYISQDSIGLMGGMVLYGYVGDVNGWLDVLGLMPWPNPTKSGHHLIYLGKAKSVGLDHLASYTETPTFFFNDPYIPGSHERVHAAQKPYVGSRQGPWLGTSDELIAASKKGLVGLDDIKGTLKIPGTGEILAENVTPLQAFEKLEEWHKDKIKSKHSH
ncbi:RHS repeat domain-containing protein [Myroides marinus]|uniref:RHS repeat domain-containing protein n=1 Tax=Myroides marinus TaxID=703342 RepID=UPI002577F7C4|nr:RHS repeat-associated core domain-containing protein [Myroides marinus]